MWLGTVSFGLYLWHMPVLYYLELEQQLPERFIPAITWILPVTFMLAALSWYLVEQPAIRASARTKAGAPRRRVVSPAEG